MYESAGTPLCKHVDFQCHEILKYCEWFIAIILPLCQFFFIAYNVYGDIYSWKMLQPVITHNRDHSFMAVVHSYADSYETCKWTSNKTNQNKILWQIQLPTLSLLSSIIFVLETTLLFVCNELSQHLIPPFSLLTFGITI